MQAVDFSVFSIMKGRYKGETHVAEFALQATKEDIRQTNVSLDVARMLYNSTLAELLRRGQKMRETERWNPLVERNRDIKAKIKPLAAIKDPAPEQITELEQALALKKGPRSSYRPPLITRPCSIYAQRSGTWPVRQDNP